MYRQTELSYWPRMTHQKWKGKEPNDAMMGAGGILDTKSLTVLGLQHQVQFAVTCCFDS